jgi:hypothetical protein
LQHKPTREGLLSDEVRRTGRYFYSINGSANGPVAWSELEHRARSGAIRPDTLVREDGAERWKLAGSLDLPFPPDMPPTASPIAAAPAKTRATFSNLIGLLVIAGAIAWWLWPRGFSDADIEGVRTSIRTEYAKKRTDLQVEDVSLIRRDKRELTGFVRVKFPGSADAQTIPCTANMDENGKQFIWSCGR